MKSNEKIKIIVVTAIITFFVTSFITYKAEKSSGLSLEFSRSEAKLSADDSAYEGGSYSFGFADWVIERVNSVISWVIP